MKYTGELLRQMFVDINKIHFNNELPDISLYISTKPENDFLATFHSYEIDGVRVPWKIVFAPHLINSGDITEIHHVMIHEMVHYKLCIDGTCDVHGDNFQNTCRDIGLGVRFGPSQEYCREFDQS